ncbi:MAG: HAD family hydrolase [Chloroflexi bacterium]|nr:HAD family hydrolase [Chloroflexota bacterium]
MTLKPPFDSIQAWLIDMDGVIYRGAKPLPAADAFIRTLQESQRPFLFLTNNATKTPTQIIARLAQMGIVVEENRVFTSAQATAAYLKSQAPPPQRVLIVGGEGLHQAISNAGYEIVNRAEEAQWVVSGLDQHVTYEQLGEATLAIRWGCPWLATNPDRTWPGERGELPGAGALVALLEAATDQHPTIIGKPEPNFFLQALARLGVSADQAVMVGDRLSTDILGGHRAGLRTICTLTGVTTQAQAEAYNPRPDWIVPDLRALLNHSSPPKTRS